MVWISFKIYEDLKIIAEVAQQEEGLSPAFWRQFQQTSRLHKRSMEMLRDRYIHFLQNLTKENFDQIFKFIQNQDLYGYIDFNKDGAWKGISAQDHSSSRPKVVAKDLDLKIFSHLINENKGFLQSQFLQADRLYDDVSPHDELEIEVHRHLNSSSFVRTHKKVKLEKESSAPAELKESKRLLQSLSQKLGISVSELIQKIESANGSVQELLTALETNDQSLLWTSKEDQLLANCKKLEDKAFQNLIRTKGKQKIRERLAFKGITLKFKLWFMISNYKCFIQGF